MHVSGSLLTAINNFPFIKRNAATACCASSPSRYSRRSAWHHGLNKLTLMGRCNDNNHRICARFMPLYGNKKKGRASIGPTKPICQRGEGCVRASLCVGDGASQCSRAPKRQCMTIQRKRCTPGGVYPHWWHTNHKAPDTQINKHKNGCWSQPQNTIKTQHTNNLFVYTLRRVTRNVRIRSNSSSSACMRIRVNSGFLSGALHLCQLQQAARSRLLFLSTKKSVRNRTVHMQSKCRCTLIFELLNKNNARSVDLANTGYKLQVQCTHSLCQNLKKKLHLKLTSLKNTTIYSVVRIRSDNMYYVVLLCSATDFPLQLTEHKNRKNI